MDKNKLRFLLLMSVFGAMGPLVRAINLPSSAIAALRAVISALALLGYILLTKSKYHFAENRKILVPMLISGLCMAIDWIGLFEAYKYTTIATATVFYYTAPIIFFLVSPLMLKEKFTKRHVFCAITAFIGMIFVSGMVENGIPSAGEIKGIVFALAGALGYSTIMLINKKRPGGDSLVRTLIQLATAAVITMPYVLLNKGFSNYVFSWKDFILLLILGIGFTAITYIEYFGLMQKIPAKTVAMFSYADPVLAVLISVIILGEPFSVWALLGTVLIIGSSIFSELK